MVDGDLARQVEGVGRPCGRLRLSSRQELDAVITIAGNNKDFPEEARSSIRSSRGADFVQDRDGFAESLGRCAVPQAGHPVHPLLFSLVARRHVTESTNGFRAFTKRCSR